MSETPEAASAASAPEPAITSNPSFISSNCGQASGSATGGPMYPGTADVSINGSTNLSQCIRGFNDSYVNTISIEPYDAPVYHNKIVVNGRGPSGFGARVEMTFVMEGGEQVTLTMRSTTVEDHTVKCRTSGLIQIIWNFQG